MIVGDRIGLILSKGECQAVHSSISKLIAQAANKDKRAVAVDYKYLQKIGLMKFIDKLKEGAREDE